MNEPQMRVWGHSDDDPRISHTITYKAPVGWITQLEAVQGEVERLRSENAKLQGELQAYRILDAAGRINREVNDE